MALRENSWCIKAGILMLPEVDMEPGDTKTYMYLSSWSVTGPLRQRRWSLGKTRLGHDDGQQI